MLSYFLLKFQKLLKSKLHTIVIELGTQFSKIKIS